MVVSLMMLWVESVDQSEELAAKFPYMDFMDWREKSTFTTCTYHNKLFYLAF